MARLEVQGDLRRRLSEALSPVEVRVRVPEARPPTLVVVTREGGRRLNSVQEVAGVGLLCWAPTEEEACSLARRAGDILTSLPRAAFLDGYEACEEETVRSDPDPETRSPRWYASYTITTHATN